MADVRSGFFFCFSFVWRVYLPRLRLTCRILENFDTISGYGPIYFLVLIQHVMRYWSHSLSFYVNRNLMPIREASGTLQILSDILESLFMHFLVKVENFPIRS